MHADENRAESLAAAAYRGDPPPADPLGLAQYFMLQRLYELYRRGALPKADAAYLKGLTLGYEALERETRRELIDAFIGSWSGEDLYRFEPEIKALSKLLLL